MRTGWIASDLDYSLVLTRNDTEALTKSDWTIGVQVFRVADPGNNLAETYTEDLYSRHFLPDSDYKIPGQVGTVPFMADQFSLSIPVTDLVLSLRSTEAIGPPTLSEIASSRAMINTVDTPPDQLGTSRRDFHP